MYSLKQTPVSGRATGAVFVHGEVKAELRAHFACNGMGVAEPGLNNEVMLQMGFSSCNLCNCMCWDLQRLWGKERVSQAAPALTVLAASGGRGFFSWWL